MNLEKEFEERISEDNGLYTAYAVKDKKGDFRAVCSIEQASKQCSELSQDIAIKFAEWMHNNTDGLYSNGWLYLNIQNGKLELSKTEIKSTQELFTLFLKEAYENENNK